jgi:peptidoglycan hydrolase-like protein with peptidoglycan-binding domain
LGALGSDRQPATIVSQTVKSEIVENPSPSLPLRSCQRMETFAYLQITQDYETQDYETQNDENLAALEPAPDLITDPIRVTDPMGLSENQSIQFVWKHFDRLKAFCKLSSPALFWLVGLLSTTLITHFSVTQTVEAATETGGLSSGVGIVDLVNLTLPTASTTTTPASTTTTSTTTTTAPTTELPLNPAPVTPVVAVNNANTTNATVTTSAIATRYFSRGDQGADVVRIQEQLRREGLFNATATGFFGTITELAVMDFQADNGLVSDGVVGPQTLAILNRIQPAAILPSSTVPSSVPNSTVSPSTPPATTTVQTTTVQTTTKPIVSAGSSLTTPLFPGDRGDNVAALQRYLKDLNYYTGEIDGIYDINTEIAVRGLQRTLGLTVDGVYGTQTIRRILV